MHLHSSQLNHVEFNFEGLLFSGAIDCVIVVCSCFLLLSQEIVDNNKLKGCGLMTKILKQQKQNAAKMRCYVHFLIIHVEPLLKTFNY